MKKNLTVCMFLIANVVFAQLSTNPSPFEVNQSVTITIDACLATVFNFLELVKTR